MLLASLLAAPFSGALGPLTGAPTNVVFVTTDEVWTGELTFVDPIVVRPGAHLVMRDATVYLDQPAWCPTRGGAGYCQPSITLDGARLTIERSVLASRLYDPQEPESGWNVAGIAAVLDIHDSVLTGMETIVMQSPGEVPSFVARNVVQDSRGPIGFIRGAVATIEDNSLAGMWMGIQAYDSASVIQRNVLRHFGRDFGAGPFGRGIDVQATIVGEKAYDGAAHVVDNVIEDMASSGILVLSNAPVVVAGNDVRAAATGITVGLVVGDETLRRATPLLFRNTLVDNMRGVQLYTSGTSNEPGAVETPTVVMRTNTFANACHDLTTERVAVHVDLLVDARENWWGSADGPQSHGPGCEAVTGVATYLVEPWLTAAP